MPRKDRSAKRHKAERPKPQAAAPAPAPPEEDAEEKASSVDPDAEPYAIGAHLLVLWTPDNSTRHATVIERAEADTDAYRYYVHYTDFNRRMDEWIEKDRVLAPPSKAAAYAAKTAAPPPPEQQQQQQQQHKAAAETNQQPGVELVVEGYGGGTGSGALDFAVTAVEDMEHNEHEGLDEASLREHEEVTKVKNVGTVELGRHVIETWYFSPFPKEFYPNGFAKILYVCERTFQFFATKKELVRWTKRTSGGPPGNEIYRKDGLAMFEVDGAEHTVFCQNLCYFAKLFLDHKTLYFDVDPFLFYVLTEYDDFGYHPVGYFSKEKHSDVGYNLACILAFPPYQRKGYGRFLIAFSYALSRKEGKVGAPEKPLSDLGHVAYRSYWSATLLQHIKQQPSLSIMELSKATSIMADDVIATLQFLGLIRSVNGTYVLWADNDLLDRLAARYPQKHPLIDAAHLHWTPFVHFDYKGRDKFSIKSKKKPPTPAPPAAAAAAAATTSVATPQVDVVVVNAPNSSNNNIQQQTQQQQQQQQQQQPTTPGAAPAPSEAAEAPPAATSSTTTTTTTT